MLLLELLGAIVIAMTTMIGALSVLFLIVEASMRRRIVATIKGWFL